MAKASEKVQAKPATKRGRQSYRDSFLMNLEALTNPETGLASNSSLRNKLGWDEDTYKRIKAQLIDEGVIFAARGGPGGAVGLVSPKGSPSLKIFISYSHKDEAFKDSLITHLSPLKRLKIIEEWNDRKINPGSEWDQVISAKMEESNIILLLVSADFIASDYCFGNELDRAIEKHSKSEAVVIPIVIRHCLWQHTPFAKLQALPKDAKAISSWQDKDEAFTAVSESIRVIANQLLTAD